MATKNTYPTFKINRITALDNAIAALEGLVEYETIADDVIVTKIVNERIQPDNDTILVLERMRDQLAKASVGSKKTSEARKRNLQLAKALLEVIPAGKAMTASEIRAVAPGGFNLDQNGNISPQHLSSVLRLMVEEGMLAVTKVARTNVYTRI